MIVRSITELYNALTYPWGTPASITSEQAIAEFESAEAFRLPSGYKEFCRFFGAGGISEHFDIAAPGYEAHGYHWDLRLLNKYVHERRWPEEIDEYCEDPARFRRLLYFCEDIDGAKVFGFDPTETTSTEPLEYAIWRMSRTWRFERVASSFLEFINNVCLPSNDPPILEFECVPRTRRKRL